MIRKMEEKDISDVLQIWLETNIKAHSFIDKEYWTGNYEMVKQILPEAEVYVYEEEKNGQIDGFIRICTIDGNWKMSAGLCKKQKNRIVFMCIRKECACNLLLSEGEFLDSGGRNR